MTPKVFDPVDSFVRLLHSIADHMAGWQLDRSTDSQRGSLTTAAVHVRQAAKHFLRANGRKVPEDPS